MQKEEIYERLNRSYFGENCDEREVLEALIPTFAKTKVFVDVGGSLGQYTHFANKHMVGGEIYAVEADPVRFEELERNCRRWMSGSTNRLSAIHAAVSDSDGETTFFTTNSNVSGGLFIHPVKSAGVQWQEVKVPTITLDAHFKDTSPDFIKIDVEGSELRVLRGAKQLLARKRTPMFIEVHSWSDPAGQRDQFEVFEFMKGMGYERKSIKGKLLFRPVA